MNDRLTDAQITEGLRLAGDAMAKFEQTYPSEPISFDVTDFPEWHPEFAALLTHAGTHYAAALAEVQALRGQVQAALAYIEPRCVEEREVIQGYVTRDMATDAGEPMMEGEPVTGVEVIEHEEWIRLAEILRGTR